MTRLEDKLAKLEESYKASMARPNLDDSDGEEQIIEKLAREVTEVGHSKSFSHHMIFRAKSCEGLKQAILVVNALNTIKYL